MPRKAKDEELNKEEKKAKTTVKKASKSVSKKKETTKKKASTTATKKKAPSKKVESKVKKEEPKKEKTVVKKVTKKVATKKETPKKEVKKVIAKKTTTSSSPKKKEEIKKDKKATTKKVAVKKILIKEEEPKKVAKKVAVKKTTSSSPKKKEEVKKDKKVATKKTVTKKTTTKKVTKKATTTKKIANKKIVKKPEIIEYYDLPYTYNRTMIRLLAQTPTTLFVYWEISNKDKEEFINKYGEYFFNNTKPILIIHNKTLNYSYELDINDFANCWYIHVNDANCEYEIELGRRGINKYISLENNYLFISNSNEIEAPNDHILFEKLPDKLLFRNVKTNNTYERATFYYLKKIKSTYNIKEFYKKMYNEEFDFSKLSLKNPSSLTSSY